MYNDIIYCILVICYDKAANFEGVLFCVTQPAILKNKNQFVIPLCNVYLKLIL